MDVEKESRAISDIMSSLHIRSISSKIRVLYHNEVDIGLPELKPHVPWKLKCVPVSLIKLMPWESGIQGC
jgi:hypothetical protein